MPVHHTASAGPGPRRAAVGPRLGVLEPQSLHTRVPPLVRLHAFALQVDDAQVLAPGSMDSLITAAARLLAVGDPLGALKRVALRDDAPALALRGIAMAQLGDLVRAKTLLRRAARAFGPKEAVARARCAVAEAEIALVSRDLGWPAKALDAARATLEEHGDRNGLRRPASVSDRGRSHPENRSEDGPCALHHSCARRRPRLGARVGGGDALGGAVSRPEDLSNRSRDRRDSSHDRVQPLRDRRHLGRWRALARHLGR